MTVVWPWFITKFWKLSAIFSVRFTKRGTLASSKRLWPPKMSKKWGVSTVLHCFHKHQTSGPETRFFRCTDVNFSKFFPFLGAKKDTAKMAYASAPCELGRDPYLAHGPRNSSSKAHKTRLRQSQPTTVSYGHTHQGVSPIGCVTNPRVRVTACIWRKPRSPSWLTRQAGALPETLRLGVFCRAERKLCQTPTILTSTCSHSPVLTHFRGNGENTLGNPS